MLLIEPKRIISFVYVIYINNGKYEDSKINISQLSVKYLGTNRYYNNTH